MRYHHANGTLESIRYDLRRLQQQITNALKAVSGVSDVNVSLSAGEATVRYDERLTSPNQLKSAVKGAGYGVDATKPTQGDQSKAGCCS